MPDDFNHDICDWLVRGDGEHPLRALCEELPARPDRMEVVIGELYDQSDPGHIDWKSYGRPEARSRALWLGTSRGCAFKCRFCVEPQRGSTYSRYSALDTLAIIEGLLETHEPRVIAFSDPLFGANRRWTEAFLDGLEERNLPLMFWAETRADLMSPDLLERFKRCGFMLDFGLDTGSETMAGRMEKTGNPKGYLERSAALLGHANDIGLHHGVYIVFNFPGETPETVLETQAFLAALGGDRGSMGGWLSCQTFFILPGTHSFLHMAHNATEYGTEIRNPGWWRQTGDHHALATDILPSAAWAGREEDLRDFGPWNQAMNQAWVARYPAEVHEFRTAFYTA
jgi:radical SAM superfamily enzyme YgiQ (UPF0313 family)